LLTKNSFSVTFMPLGVGFCRTQQTARTPAMLRFVALGQTEMPFLPS
jgi:hypothetical protein